MDDAVVAGIDPGRIRDELARACLRTRGAVQMLLATADGQVIAAFPNTGLHESRLGTMTGALLGMGQMLSREFGLAAVDHVVIGCGRGHLVLAKVGGRAALMLVAYCASGTTANVLKFVTRICALRIAGLLDTCAGRAGGAGAVGMALVTPPLRRQRPVALMGGA